MATFEFSCRKCKETFAIANLTYKESRNVYCQKCNTKDVEMVGYDRANQQALHRLAHELALLEQRVNAIIDFIQECAEEEGAPEFDDPKANKLE